MLDRNDKVEIQEVAMNGTNNGITSGVIYKYQPVLSDSNRCGHCGYRYGTDYVDKNGPEAFVMVMVLHPTRQGVAECGICDFEEPIDTSQPTYFFRVQDMDGMVVVGDVHINTLHPVAPVDIEKYYIAAEIEHEQKKTDRLKRLQEVSPLGDEFSERAFAFSGEGPALPFGDDDDDDDNDDEGDADGADDDSELDDTELGYLRRISNLNKGLARHRLAQYTSNRPT